ncbi:SMP-30/gluconolactonase/LRE family protein [Povalibacter sp.]|uniref:SMP-30/gluconolactonase/LRE family protein n=1 Tax=Povalibacter sp. TaxID=1962978 RepID=UPI002F3F4CB3
MRTPLILARFVAPLLATLIAYAPMNTQAATLGSVERLDPAISAIVPSAWTIERLAEGFTWSEGPVWIDSGNYLLFTDVPGNTMYRWSQNEGLSVFLKPSGYTGTQTGIFREPGANGLFPDRQGSILMADHGNRQVARFDLATKTKTPLATHFEGKRFNSPNDVTRRSDGVIFFTDPPYGLEGLNESKHKELPFNGVYRIDIDGTVHLLDRDMTFPNGLALSPDERTLYVANSDPQRPIWMAFALNERGEVIGKRVFADSSDLMGADVPGLPDGMRVTPNGTVFATAPGGVLIMDSNGKRLGRIRTGSAIANCAFGDDGRTLYMTSHNFLARIRLDIQGNR